MDKSSALGLMLLVVAIIGGILSSDAPVVSFVNLPSIFIVLVGTFGAVMISYRLHIFIEALINIAHAFRVQTIDPLETIDKLVDLADVSRKGGYLSLEEVSVEDPFIIKARDLLIDGHDAETLDAVLTKEIFLTKERNNASVKVLNSFTEIAPAMGMIGTLIGLVAMLVAMEDPKTIGKSMSVALLTTLYGALVANGITGPLARKLSERSAEIRTHQAMIRDAFVRIANGENPKAIFEFLQSYLDEKRRRPMITSTELSARSITASADTSDD
jgi:chemotaxis protein MotA